MNGYVASLFRKKPTAAEPQSVVLSKAIEAHEAELSALEAELSEADSAFGSIVTMTDADIEAAEQRRTMARRRRERQRARLAELREAHASAVECEAEEALNARVKAVKRRVEVDAPKALDRYDANAAATAEAAGEFDAICREVEAINRELHAKGLPPIDDPNRLFRKEPDRVTPERRETRDFWEEYDPYTGQWSKVVVYHHDSSGNRVPAVAGARRRRSLPLRGPHLAPGFHRWPTTSRFQPLAWAPSDIGLGTSSSAPRFDVVAHDGRGERG
jgi:hypothetical protein